MGLLSWIRAGDEQGSHALPPPPTLKSRSSLIGHTLRFHDAAHDEVCAHVRGCGSSAVRMNVIARSVALITSYEDACTVLRQEWQSPPAVSRKQAYDMLMSAFYSPPCLLLEDEDDEGAQAHCEAWQANIAQTITSSSALRESIEARVQAWQGDLHSVDLYDACKELGHALALGTFLGINAQGESDLFDSARECSEAMLRGQFTLPVGLNVGFYQNTFSRGLAAKGKFDAMVAERIEANKCPFAAAAAGDGGDALSNASLASHHSMFASSLVVKAFASLCMAVLLQLWRRQETTTLAERLVTMWTSGDGAAADALLDSILTETERVAPPIIGVMRRVTAKDGVALSNSGQLDSHSSQSSEQLCVPSGWDAWPYFPLCNRDASVFGKESNTFDAERYNVAANDAASPPPPLSFGAGVKACPGREVIRAWLSVTVRTLLLRRDGARMAMQFDQDGLDEGVQDWLGWRPIGDGDCSWKGIKQLPTQRPRQPVNVTFVAALSS